MASESGPYNRPNAERVTLESELCEIEAALHEAEEQAAYWSAERARLYESPGSVTRWIVGIATITPKQSRPVAPTSAPGTSDGISA